MLQIVDNLSVADTSAPRNTPEIISRATGSIHSVTVILLVGVGGALGSIARYLLSTWIQRSAPSGFPWGTYAVNGTGSFMIGLVFAFFDGGLYSSDALVFLVAGILGGYTTFSTFSVENLKLIENRRPLWLLQNTVGQVAGGLVFAAIGYWIGSVVL